MATVQNLNVGRQCPWWISRHAVDRLRDRVMPGAPWPDVFAYVTSAALAAVQVAPDRYASPETPGVVYLVRPPREPGQLPMLVTVLYEAENESATRRTGKPLAQRRAARRERKRREREDDDE